MSISIHRLPLNDVEVDDLKGISVVIESNAHIFNDYLLAPYGGDASYSVCDGSFEVTDIADGYIEFCYDIQYFNGCKDMNFIDQKHDNLEYSIDGNQLIFELDETAWRVEM
ncbi:hypothetical protein [Citrobacter portucalensis]|uniref:hypothetical protein n=1 Tax=Citrobacter portucalensis TaxID=1639133 RepID=UPI003978F6EC